MRNRSKFTDMRNFKYVKKITFNKYKIQMSAAFICGLLPIGSFPILVLHLASHCMPHIME